MGQWAPGCPQGVNPITGPNEHLLEVRNPFIVFQNFKKSTQLHSWLKIVSSLSVCMCVCLYVFACVCAMVWIFSVLQHPGKHNCSTNADCEGGGYKRTGNGKSWQRDSVWPPPSSLGNRLSADPNFFLVARIWELRRRGWRKVNGGDAVCRMGCGMWELLYTHTTHAKRTSTRFTKVNI